MTADTFVELWRCPSCSKPYRAPLSIFERIKLYLPSESRGRPSVVFLCEACNGLHFHRNTDRPLRRMSNTEDQGRFVWVQNIFGAQIACAEKSCEFSIEILSPRTIHWNLEAVQRLDCCSWIAYPGVVCVSKHASSSPVEMRGDWKLLTSD